MGTLGTSIFLRVLNQIVGCCYKRLPRAEHGTKTSLSFEL